MLHNQIRCGVALFPPNWVDLELAVYAESLGFDDLWIGEHIAFHIPTFDAITTMAAVAASTTQIGIGIAAAILPLRPAAAMAKAITTLDIISTGRLRLGVGVGGEFPKEFEAVGIPLRERGKRTDEAIEIMRALWAPGSASYQGRFVQFKEIRMEPKPVQKNGPPILVGGRSEAAIRRAATLGDGFMPYLFTPDQYARTKQQLLQFRAAANRPASELSVPMYQFIYASDNNTKAQQLLAARLEEPYQQPFEQLVSKYCTAGTPETCRRSLQAYVDAGVREFILTPPVTSPSEFRQQLDLFAGDIVPKLQV